MIKDQENKSKGILNYESQYEKDSIKNNNVIDIESKINNSDAQNKSEMCNMREIIELDKKEIIRLTEKSNYYQNKYEELCGILNSYNNILINNITPYNQYTNQTNLDMNNFITIMRQLQDFYSRENVQSIDIIKNNCKDMISSKDNDVKYDIELLLNYIDEDNPVRKTICKKYNIE